MTVIVLLNNYVVTTVHERFKTEEADNQIQRYADLPRVVNRVPNKICLCIERRCCAASARHGLMVAARDIKKRQKNRLMIVAV